MSKKISRPHLGRKRFILLNSSSAGLQLARGLRKTGNFLVRVVIGTPSPGGLPTVAIKAEDAYRFRGNVPIENLDTDSESNLAEMPSLESHDFAAISWPKLLSRKVIEAGSRKITGTYPAPFALRERSTSY